MTALVDAKFPFLRTLSSVTSRAGKKSSKNVKNQLNRNPSICNVRSMQWEEMRLKTRTPNAKIAI
jgi:hypothetical protein